MLEIVFPKYHWTTAVDIEASYKSVPAISYGKYDCSSFTLLSRFSLITGEGLSDRLVEGTVKFGGGSVMLWGRMLWDGPGYACRIDGRMDGDLFIQILRLVLLFQPSQR